MLNFKKKRRLRDQIIEDGDRNKNFISKLTVDDIKKLLSFEK